MPDKEEWRAIPGFDGLYEVSNCGRVRSVDRILPWRHTMVRYKSKIISPINSWNGGYLAVGLWIGNTVIRKLIHRLVIDAFVGLKDDLFVDHIDGERNNNHISNLRVCTRSQNNQNRRRDADNKSGFKGVFRLPSGKYQAYITANGVRQRLGTFPTAEEAHAVRCKAAYGLHGEFARND